MLHREIKPVWADRPVIVAATGPSLTTEVAKRVRYLRWFEHWRVVCVNDAYKLIPYADILYACDERWWDLHKGAPNFHGQRWSSHSERLALDGENKLKCADRYGLNLIEGVDGEGWSTDPTRIHYIGKGGGQAINLTLLHGARRIVLVGFDHRIVHKRVHFFGDHPAPLANMVDDDFRWPIHEISLAAKALPPEISIVNATPDSRLTCFPMMSLEDACKTEIQRPNGSVHRDRAESDSRTTQ